MQSLQSTASSPSRYGNRSYTLSCGVTGLWSSISCQFAKLQAYIAKLKTSVKRTGALTAAQSQHVSGMLAALARCASYSQDAVSVERPEAASAVEANAADEVGLHSATLLLSKRD